MQLLQLAFGVAVVLSFGLLGRMMAMHDALPAGPRGDHVDSSLHKIMRQQRRLEEHMLMQRQLKMSLEVHEQYLQTLLATGIVEPGEKEKGSGASAGAGGSGGEPRRRGV